MSDHEQRKDQRMRALKGARIVYDNGCRTRDCTIRNVSQTGAKLVMENTRDLPDAFQLLFDDGARKYCQVRWRKINELGVAFVDTLGSSTIVN